MRMCEVFVVCDHGGEYVSDSEGLERTPACGEAYEFTDRRAAQAACRRVTDRVRVRVIDLDAVQRGDSV